MEIIIVVLVLPVLLAGIGVPVLVWWIERPWRFDRKKSNLKKLYKRLYKIVRPLEDAVRRLQTLDRLQKEKPSLCAIAGMLSDDVIKPGFLAEIKSVDLAYAPLLAWKKRWTRNEGRWSRGVPGTVDTVSVLKHGATTAYKIAFDLQLQIVQREIIRQETRCRELQGKVTAMCADLGIEPVVVYAAQKPESEAALPPATKRAELQKLRVRVAELEEEVLAEQGGEGPLRRPAGIPRDN